MKKQGATIKNWQFHRLSSTVEYVREKGLDVQINEVLVFTGIVVIDPAGKMQPGLRLRSSVICKYDPDTGICETQNTVYILIGEESGDSVPDMGDNVVKLFY